MRKKVLWLTDEVPDPDFGGGSIRQYQLLRRMCERADVDLLLVGTLRDEQLKSVLHSVVEFPAPPAPSARRQWVIDRLSTLPGRTPTEVRLAKPKVDLLRRSVPDA